MVDSINQLMRSRQLDGVHFHEKWLVTLNVEMNFEKQCEDFLRSIDVYVRICNFFENLNHMLIIVHVLHSGAILDYFVFLQSI
jgi:hypothetical protein